MSESLAWAAGFFEGEGCFTKDKRYRKLNGKHSVYPKASISQKGLNGKLLLEKFKAIIGFGSIYYEVRSDMWRYNIPAKLTEFMIFYLLLEPWLSPRRCIKAQEIIQECIESKE